MLILNYIGALNYCGYLSSNFKNKASYSIRLKIEKFKTAVYTFKFNIFMVLMLQRRIIWEEY